MIYRYPGHKGGLSVHEWLGGLFILALDWESDMGLKWGARFIEAVYFAYLFGLTAFLAWVIS